MSANPKAVPCLATLAGSSNSVAFHPTARLLAIGSDDRTVKLWGLSPNNSSAFCVDTLTGYSEAVTSVAFDPTGTLLATCTPAKLWQLSLDNSSAMTLEGHSRWVTCVAFHPTARLLATGSEDSTVKLWGLSADGATCVATLKAGRGEVTSLGFDPTGTVLATGNVDGTKLWDCRQFQRKNVTDDFKEISSVLAKKLVGDSVKGHSSMKSAITHRVALGKGERWLGVNPYMAARVSEHLKKLYRMRSANGSVVVPFNFPGVQHRNMMKLLKNNKPEDDDKRSGGSKWTRARPRSKSKSKMMNINRTTLKRKPPKQH